MSDSFHYSTTFVLDKAHFNECFSNSVVLAPPLVAYRKAMILLLIGFVIILLTEVNAYVGYFVIGLGIVEALGCYFQQPWWVTRQLFGRSGNSEVTMTVDDSGVHTDSAHVKGSILWQDINGVNETKDGIVIMHKQGKSYISAQCLSVEAKHFIVSKG